MIVLGLAAIHVEDEESVLSLSVTASLTSMVSVLSHSPAASFVRLSNSCQEFYLSNEE